MEQNRTDKLIAVSEFNRFKATADTEILKLQDDKKCVDQKTLQLQEEYIDTVPLKFKTLGISFELISAEMVTRVRLLQSEIDQLKSQEATQLPIWTQDLLKREQDLANILAKLSLGQIRDDLFLIESEEKLNEDIDTEEGSLIILRRRVLSARERIDGIRRHSSQQKDQTPQTQPMVSYSAPMSSATAQESSDFQPSPVVHTITTTITKTLIEEVCYLQIVFS